MELPDYCLDKDFPGYFRLGFTGFLKGAAKDVKGEKLTLKIVPSNSPEVKMPPKWGRVGYASLIDETGRFWGAISDTTFFRVDLRFGDVVVCPVRTDKPFLEIFVPFSTPLYTDNEKLFIRQ